MNKKSFSYLAAVEVFILSPDKREVLLLKRAKNKLVLPGYFAGLGGKMDNDIESPFAASYREMEEESGYNKDSVKDLHLAGIYTVKDSFGKWLIFEFVCTAKFKKVFNSRHTKEGTLFWVKIKDLSKKRLIPDLRKGILEKMLVNKKPLFVTVSYKKENIKKLLIES